MKYGIEKRSVYKCKLKDLYLKKEKNIFNDLGSAVVEATLIIPLFLFAILALYNMCRCVLAEGIIYEAAAETVEYMAEYSYIDEPDLLMPSIIMPKYIDDKDLVNRNRWNKLFWNYYKRQR